MASTTKKKGVPAPKKKAAPKQGGAKAPTKKVATKKAAAKKSVLRGHSTKGAIVARSSAHHPDLDWSQIRETVLMLGLAVAQIESSMRDGNESVNVLGNSFTSMYGAIQTIALAASSLPNSGKSAQAKQAIEHNCTQVSGQMQEVIMAMQFYDKLTQRLSHVTHSMEALADIVADQGRLFNPYEWAGLQEKIRSKYTIEEERVMFDAIMRGSTVEEALEMAEQTRRRKEAEEVAVEDNIDLF